MLFECGSTLYYNMSTPNVVVENVSVCSGEHIPSVEEYFNSKYYRVHLA